MTNEQIDHLIAARNAITARTDDYPNMRAVDHIDAVLRDVPAGQRADVDALLGRRRISIDEAQRAGSDAYERTFEPAKWNIASANDAYQSAYDASVAEQTKRIVMVQHSDGAVEVAPEFGPQPAPDDYRIANRPDNPNWHGVKAWFNDAAKTSQEE